VDADHVELGASPAGTGQVRATDGLLLAWDNSGTDRHALATSGPDLTVGPGAGAVAVDVGAAASFSVTDGGTPRILATHLATSIEKKIGLYSGAVTHAATKGDVGLDSTGHLTVWTGGAESSLVAQSDALSGDLGGTLGSTPQVVGLRGVSIDATPPALNQVLAYDGTKWKATAPSGGGGGATVYPALDSHDLGYWTFDEASGNFANQGTAGSVDIVPVPGSTTYYGQATPFGSGAFIGQNGAASGVTTAFRPAQFTMIAFFRPFNSFNGSDTTVFAVYDSAASVTPFGVYWFNSSTHVNSMNWYAYFSQSGGGSLQLDVTSSNADDWRAVPWREWAMMVITYDGATYKAYLNGGLVASQASGTGPDYSTANTKVVAHQNLLMGLLRIRDTAMSASDVRLAYRHAMGWA
jgi:hypothetical protein